MSNVIRFPTAVPALDPGLIERIKARDPVAIADLYRKHHAKVRSFARRMLGDASAAEDVVHDVFVALPARSRGSEAKPR